MSLVTISQLSKGFGAQTVLSDVSLRVGRGEKIGIVGKNGGGKTTLLKLLIGMDEPDGGSVKVVRGVRIGYLSQIAQLDDDLTVEAEARTSLSVLDEIEAELRETERALAASPNDENALDAYQSARDRFDFAGGDAAEENLQTALLAMGFGEADLQKSVAVLSGGEKTRLAMAKLLASSPDVLALDEPTNHLDIRAVEWLEAFLQRFPGAVLIVSHDRRLLEAVAETIWEVEAHGVKTYNGGYAGYREQRAADRLRQAEEYERQQGEIEKLEAFVRKNREGNLSRQAKSREKTLAHMERVEAVTREPTAMKARLQSSGRSGREVVVVERATKRYGAKMLLDNVTFSLERGDRVGVVGPNGVGKTTFIEMVLGEEAPDAGFVRRGHAVTVAYHKQEADDFDADQSVLENFYELSGLPIAESRAKLARFLFTGEDVFKPVSALSGGERSKLAMAVMVLSPANLLILDEPTNHLDVYSCDALTESLLQYDGTLLLVSHDRALLDAVTNKTLALPGNGKFELFDGPYHAYREAQDALAAKAPPAPNNGGAKPKGKNGNDHLSGSSIIGGGGALSARELSKERQRAAKRVATVEAEVERLETRLAEIETALSSPKSADNTLALSKDYAQTQADLSARMTDWEAATAEAEALGVAA